MEPRSGKHLLANMNESVKQNQSWSSLKWKLRRLVGYTVPDISVMKSTNNHKGVPGAAAADPPNTQLLTPHASS